MNQAQKKKIRDLIPMVRDWFSRPGNRGGGVFHVVLEDGNHEQEFADLALVDARKSGDTTAIELAEKLAALTDSERRKLCDSW